MKTQVEGEYLFVAQEGGVHIVHLNPGEQARKVASIELRGWAYGILVFQKEIFVFEDLDREQSERSTNFGRTKVQIFSIADPSQPKLLRTMTFQGYLTDARLVNEQVLFAINRRYLFTKPFWSYEFEKSLDLPIFDRNLRRELNKVELDKKVAELRAKATEILKPEIESQLKNVNLEAMFSTWIDLKFDDATAKTQLLNECESMFLANIPPEGFTNTLSLVHYDPKQKDVKAMGIMGSIDRLYAHQDRYYLAQTHLRSPDDGKVEQFSLVHQFDFKAEFPFIYSAGGKVDGWMFLKNMMNEHQGYLRVASYYSSFNGTYETWIPETLLVNVMKNDRQGQLIRQGTLSGIKATPRADEIIMKEGFGFITHKYEGLADSLLDLSEPQSPILANLPGTASLRHLSAVEILPDNKILLVGHQQRVQNQQPGLQLQLLEVKKSNAIQTIDTFVHSGEDWQWPSDPALSFVDGILTVAQNRGVKGDTARFSGAQVYRVDTETGFEVLGEIDHSNIVENSLCLRQRWGNVRGIDCIKYGWQVEMNSTLHLNGYLYSVSNYGLFTSTDESLEKTANPVLFWPK